jgi:hypothetical protein
LEISRSNAEFLEEERLVVVHDSKIGCLRRLKSSAYSFSHQWTGVDYLKSTRKELRESL